MGNNPVPILLLHNGNSFTAHANFVFVIFLQIVLMVENANFSSIRLDVKLLFLMISDHIEIGRRHKTWRSPNWTQVLESDQNCGDHAPILQPDSGGIFISSAVSCE